MKKLLVIIFLVLFSLSLITWVKSKPGSIISTLTRSGGIKTGELRYRVYILWVLPVGEAVFEPEKAESYQGKKVYHLKAVAQSLSMLSGFFKASAVIESYVEISNFNPLLFKQIISIAGKPTIEKEVSYDQVNNTMTLAGVKREVLPDTQDPISATYNIRHMDFAKTKSVEMNINTNQKNYILEGSAKEEEIEVGGKKYGLVFTKAQIRRRDKNNPYHRSQINMILLKVGNENIPILIKVFASGFPVTARLVEIK